MTRRHYELGRGRDLNGLVSRLPDVIYRVRLWPSFAVDYVSEPVALQTGHEPEEFLADSTLVFRIIYPDDRHLLEERLKAGPTEQTIVLRWQRTDGKVIWVEHKETAIQDRSGRLIAIEGVARVIPDPTRPPGATIRVMNGVRIDLAARAVHVDGRPVHLSPVEYRLLVCLTDAPGTLRTQAELMRCLWESGHTGRGHTCANYVSALRRKICRNPHYPERILTIRGRGYKYAAD